MAVVSGQVKMKLLNLLFLLSTKFGKKLHQIDLVSSGSKRRNVKPQPENEEPLVA